MSPLGIFLALCIASTLIWWHRIERAYHHYFTIDRDELGADLFAYYKTLFLLGETWKLAGKGILKGIIKELQAEHEWDEWSAWREVRELELNSMEMYFDNPKGEGVGIVRKLLWKPWEAMLKQGQRRLRRGTQLMSRINTLLTSKLQARRERDEVLRRRQSALREEQRRTGERARSILNRELTKVRILKEFRDGSKGICLSEKALEALRAEFWAHSKESKKDLTLMTDRYDKIVKELLVVEFEMKENLRVLV